MNLSKIEIVNFKSYRESHTIEIKDRFTTIIGPNGSGKSNILDAISFVFMANSSSLRIKTLKSLIAEGKKECKVAVHINNSVFERQLAMRGNEETISKFFFNGNKISQSEYINELQKINIFCKIPNYVIYQGDIIKGDIDLLKIIENVSGSIQFKEDCDKCFLELEGCNKELSILYEKKKNIFENLKKQKKSEEAEVALQNLVEEKEMIEKYITMKEIQNKNDEITVYKAEINRAEKSIENTIIDVGGLTEARSKTSTLQKEYFELESEISFLRSKIDGSSDFNAEEKIDLEEQLKKHEEELSQIKTYDLEKIKTEMEEKQNLYEENVLEIENKINKIELVNFDKIVKKDELLSKINNLNKIKNRNEKILQENENKREKINQLKKNIFELESKAGSKIKNYENILLDERRLNDSLNEVVQKILICKSKKSDNLRSAFIRSVIENLKTMFSGVFGSVMEIVKPSQSRFDVALGTLISKYEYAVIVDNEKTAYNCLRYLKESKSCRLIFLPLNRIKYSINKNLNTFDDSILLAKNCCYFDSKFQNIIDFIFKDSIIIDNLTEAKNMAFKKGYPGNICTLTGVIFRLNGLITGGGKNKNKFEENEIDDLLIRRKTIIQDLKAIGDRKEAFSDVKLVMDKIDEMRKRMESIKFLDLEIFDQNLFASLNNELKSFDLLDFEKEKLSLKEEMKRMENKIFYPILKKIGISNVLEYKEIIKQSFKREELNMKISNLKERISITVMNKEPKDNIKQIKELLHQKEALLDDLYEKLEISKNNLKGLNNKFKTLNEERMKVLNNISKNKVYLARAEEDLKDLKNYTEEDYDKELDLIENIKNVSINVNGIKSMNLKDLRSQLDSINEQIKNAAPNLNFLSDNSIQKKYYNICSEYEIAKSKFLDVKKRFLDVKNARVECFNDCFLKITREIPLIYKSLSYNDVLDNNLLNVAYLAYEGDVFVNNIKYYLMPPFKRFTEFSELSGGEKSLALLCFIFALSKFRNPPFYIFDEVDSALDKVNVEKLANFIANSEDQFLIISLKHHFFKHSESLVGVYKCPFDNKSKILTYKLN